MDSRTHLDYVLFQLTPTRTRCDLVLFAGGKSEKLASGLLEPFLSHLKQAKDQISKGGYSLTLRPTSSNASWFTKATLERFVRFVSTPEVLERFITIEREIIQIENSIQVNEQANGVAEAEGGNPKTSAPPKVESKGSADATLEENSKVHLLRALETRKLVLRKEQAMAYARALVAGFEIDNLDDLILFSDAFGALRLREACIDFRELCNKKSTDGIWMDEVAAMQACSQSELSFLGTSGIHIAGESNTFGISTGQHNGLIDASASDSTSDANLDNGLPKAAIEQSTESKVQIPPWAQYMHNFQGPAFQQMPPYQGYFLPGMQLPHYPPNVPWPSSVDDSNLGLRSDGNRKRSASRNNQEISNRTRSTSKESNSNDPSQSSSSSDSDDIEGSGRRNSTDKSHRSKPGKRSSRKVVIRNINYITSKRNEERGSSSEDDSSDEDEFPDAGSLKQKVDEALGTLEKHHKSASRKNKKQDLSKKISYESDDVADQGTKKIVSLNSEGEKKSQDWDVFQNLLMKDTDSRVDDMSSGAEQYQELVNHKNSGEGKSSSFNLESEQATKLFGSATDSFMFGEKSVASDGRPDPVNIEAGKSVPALLKRGSAEEELMLLKKIEASDINSREPSSGITFESSTIKIRGQEDWIVNHELDKFPEHAEKVGNANFYHDESSVFAGERFHVEGNKKDVILDDSLMIQGGPVSFPSQPEPKMDIFLESNIADPICSSHDKFEGSKGYEPDDLYMVLGRDSEAEKAVTSWNPEMDFVKENSFPEAAEKHSDVELTAASDNKKPVSSKATKGTANRSLGGKVPNKVAKGSTASLGRSRSEILMGSKKTPTSKTVIKRSKAEQEEENRKRMEQLMIQRQKRIAERSSVNGSTGVNSRITSKENKIAAASAKNDKTSSKASTEDTKKVNKTVFRSSTADRLSTARAADTRSSAITKEVTKKVSNSVSQKSVPHKQKLNEDKIVPQKKFDEAKYSNGHSSVSEARGRDGLTTEVPKQTEDAGENSTLIIKEVQSVPLTEKNNGDTISNEDSSSVLIQASNGLSGPDQNDPMEGNVMVKANASIIQGLTGTDSSPLSMTEISCNPLSYTTSNVKENGSANGMFLAPSMDESGTPPPDDETNHEMNHSRKKWNDGESSPKVSKGFRKLLLFGRKS